MDKSAIKNFAVNARRRLREQVEQKAFELGIKANEIKDVEMKSSDAIVIGGRVFNADIKRQRETLVNRIKQKGFDLVMDEVSYTWFNRFIALRFMEVNDYLDSGVRVFSNREAGKQEPEILSRATTIDLPLNKEKIYEHLDRNESEELFKYLIIAQCNVLSKPLPFMFEKIADYTELLFPDKLLNEDSIIREMVNSISEEDWREVEIIGWLYQYYISEKKDELIQAKKRYQKEELPAVTQLFTPDWMVRYMVQNSLGRYWLEAHDNKELQSSFEFYLEPRNLEENEKNKLEPFINHDLKPEDIKVFDPACGSGHILVYAFDVLYEIYKSAGYSEIEIPRLILEKNLYGLDIDDRAAQLACFSIMMKARSKSRRILREEITLNVCAIQETNTWTDEDVCFLAGQEKGDKYQKIKLLASIFEDAKIYGSLTDVSITDLTFYKQQIYDIKREVSSNIFVNRDELIIGFESIVKQIEIMTPKYDVTITNPPYMSNKYMHSVLANFISNNYPECKADLFAAFIKRSMDYTNIHGHIGLVTPYVWMFIQSYEKLRKNLVSNKTLSSLIQLEYNAFEVAVVPVCTFTLRNYFIEYPGDYIDLSEFRGWKNQPIKVLESIKNPDVAYRYSVLGNNFYAIPGNPIAYSISENLKKVFIQGEQLEKYAEPKSGLSTGENDRFMRLWYEVNIKKVGFDFTNREDACNNDFKWFPFVRGGQYRKWYGNLEYLINWYKDGEELKAFKGATIRNPDYYFRQGITWSDVSSSKFAARFSPSGSVYCNMGSAVFVNDDSTYYYLALLCSSVIQFILQILNPTMHYGVGNIASLPVLFPDTDKIKEKINQLAEKNLIISKSDWDHFETSWNFYIHPILKYRDKTEFIERAYLNWRDSAESQFYQLKANEEEINRIFIDIYGLQDELTPDVEEKDVTIRRADRERDIRSFVSYAVGCMMGRYSLDEQGLIYAGGEFNPDRYNTYPADHDAIIPVLDGDYFEDDIVAQFIAFVKTVFGEKSLTANLDVIAAALGKKDSETSVERIRKYFLNDFYKDHLQVYKKRPIYWLFTSGKQKAFNALIYMHRYDKDTIARIRTDYLHELQGKYELETRRLEEVVASSGNAKEKRDASKRLIDLNKQKEELRKYDEFLRHAADQQIEIDLDDGVVVNYAKFSGLLAKI